MFSKHYLYIVHGTSSWNISGFICFLSVKLKSNIPIMFEEWYISLKFTYPIKMFHKVLKNTKGSCCLGRRLPEPPENNLWSICVWVYDVSSAPRCVFVLWLSWHESTPKMSVCERKEHVFSPATSRCSRLTSYMFPSQTLS